jgi:tetratricopeptide (TPR) repeat protein
MKGGFMSRKTTILTLIVLVSLTGACAKQEPVSPAEEAWSTLVEAWNGLETAQEKTTLAEDYLADFPDTEHSGSMAGVVVYYRGHELEDPQGAYDILAPVLEQIEDPEQRFEVSMELLSLADSVEVPLELAQVANSLGAHRPLSYSEHQRVFETAIDLEDWIVADEHSLAALEMATPEAYRADYPDREFTDEDVAERAQTRKATALAYDGWALYNMGDTEMAFARFAAADDVGSVSYVGVPNTPLYTFWGRAALAEGDLDSAIQLLGAEAAFGEDGSGAEVYLREAFAAKNGDEEGFDEFLWATRNELATTVDDFTLLDYEGHEISMADVSTGKVTLLAFWFPT